MEILFNTHYPEAAASLFYLNGLKLIGENFTIGNWQNYKAYDVVLFMTYPKDLEALKNAKEKYPGIKTGLIDPRNSTIIKYLSYIDFFIVDSIEMYDFFIGYRKPIFVYAEYPNIKEQQKIHTNKTPIIIAYHGNKVHMAGMKQNISPALDKLSEKYDLEFWAIYNIEKDRPLKFGLPEKMKTKHIQWTNNIYEKVLSQADIGIAPALMPIHKIKLTKKKASVFINFFGEVNEDYLLRFKMPSNPGRMIVFAKLGIPVVADFHPSAMQFIDNEKNGLLAYSSGAWYYALERLIINSNYRQQLADKMLSKVKRIYDFDIQNKALLYFFENSILKNYKENALEICNSKDKSSYLRRHAKIDYLNRKFYYLKKYLKK